MTAPRSADAPLHERLSEVGALCERLEAAATGLSVGSKAGWPILPMTAADLRAALAHLRRLGQVEAEVVRLQAFLMERLGKQALADLYALAPAPAAEPAHDQ